MIWVHVLSMSHKVVDLQDPVDELGLHPEATYEGEISQVAADCLIDERTGRSYFVAHVAIDWPELEWAGGIGLRPDVPAGITIVTGRQTASAT
jgi:hypothetical protein